MKKEVPNKATLDAATRFIVNDPRGRAFLQWLLNKECDVEMPMLAATFDHDESRRELGRKIRQLIADNYNRTKIVEIEEEHHG
jgi:hypothetical protein